MKNIATKLKTLAVAGMTMGLALGAQAAQDPVSYMTWDDTQKRLVEDSCTSYTLVTANDTEWNAGWYVVSGTVTIDKTVTCKGAVHLILKDGAKLAVTGEAGKAGICVSGDSNSFAVYGQSGQSGELVATCAGMYGAGIGGSGSIISVATDSNITINGGKVTATGGVSAAGIGGGFNGAGSDITINGGTVIATGGNSGAGIGGGYEGTGSNITINGGKVTAVGNGGGAGIGGGDQVAGSDITINGGNVTATGAAGGAGIGGGSFGSGSNITINGGTVTATGGASGSISGAGIGGGNKGVGSNITIDGGVVTATAGDADAAGIGNGKGASTTATGIKASASLNVKVSTDNTNWSTITHTAESDIATDLAGKQYVKVLPPVAYMAWKADEKRLDEATCNDYELVTSGDTGWGDVTTEKWYVVDGEIAINNTVTCKGAVHLIVKDGAKLTVTGKDEGAGICVSGDGNSFAVYGQSGQSGELVASGNSHAAGIGGGSSSKESNGSNITIDGGIVTAKGVGGGAGIGGGGSGKGSDITINGGTVTAIGSDGEMNGGSAGIGGGCCAAGSNIAINGGTVNATGGANSDLSGAGIGGGGYAAGSGITINGGDITATGGGDGAAGIGSGKNGSSASDIYVNPLMILKADNSNPPTTVINHASITKDIASDLAGKRYATVTPPVEYLAPVYNTPGDPTSGIKEWETLSTNIYQFVTKDTAKLSAGWWVVDGTVERMSNIAVEGAVHLILKDGCSLTVNGNNISVGIKVSGDGNSLAIYGQSAGTGKLNATASNPGGAGIGGGSREGGSNITINGGTVTATGIDGGAGIGGGILKGGFNITINGGTVTATGGAGAAAIGSGMGGDSASGIYVNPILTLKADGNNPPETVIEHASGEDIAGKLAGQKYATVTPPMSANVTVELPEVADATARLLAFNVNGGWASVATNEVPSNATVRVVYTAADGKAWEDGVYVWSREMVATESVQTAPAPAEPTAWEGSESSVTLNIDTRTVKKYFEKDDILPIWYAAGAEVKVSGTTLIKNAANTNTVSWVPAEQGTYNFSQNGFDDAQIIYTTPVEVTTNGLEVSGTTVAVTVDGSPIEPQTEGTYAGKLMVASNSTVTATWTATGSGVYFMDGSTTYTQTFEAGKAVNPVSEAVTKPEEPKAPKLKLGVVGQRYPWDDKIDVQYWAQNTPNEGYKITITVTLPDDATVSETYDCKNGKNTVAFDARAAFGEVQFKSGVKVKATLEKK